MDVFVIAIQSTGEFIRDLGRIIYDAKIYIQKAVDVRSEKPEFLFGAHMIAENVFHSIKKGRMQSWEVPSLGAVGLVYSNLQALKRGEGTVLILEEDFRVTNPTKFKRELNILRKLEHAFDVAVFGVRYQGKVSSLKRVDFLPKGWFYMDVDSSYFWCTHAVLYSSSGRRKILDLIEGAPVSMQWDSMLGMYSNANLLTILIQASDPSVEQMFHPSSIQKMEFDFLVYAGMLTFAFLICCICGSALMCALHTRHRIHIV